MEEEKGPRPLVFVGLRYPTWTVGFWVHNTLDYDMISLSSGIELIPGMFRLGFVFLIIGVEFTILWGLDPDKEE